MGIVLANTIDRGVWFRGFYLGTRGEGAGKQRVQHPLAAPVRVVTKVLSWGSGLGEPLSPSALSCPLPVLLQARGRAGQVGPPSSAQRSLSVLDLRQGCWRVGSGKMGRNLGGRRGAPAGCGLGCPVLSSFWVNLLVQTAIGSQRNLLREEPGFHILGSPGSFLPSQGAFDSHRLGLVWLFSKALRLLGWGGGGGQAMVCFPPRLRRQGSLS